MSKLSKILDIASTAAKMILENGGETYRSEDIVSRICNVHGASSNCFAVLSGIMVSVSMHEKTISTVIRIKKRTINLEKVHQINDLARNTARYTTSQFMTELKNIDNVPRYSISVNLFAYSITAASFAVLFGGTPKDFWGTLPLGAALYLLSYSFSKYELNGIFVNTLGGAISAFLAYFFKSIGFIDNVDLAIIGALMVLVPGIALTNGIRDIIAGDIMAGMARGTEALLIATSLAVGTGVAISICVGGHI